MPDTQKVRAALARLREIEAAATPGPWAWYRDYQLGARNHWCLSQEGDHEKCVDFRLVTWCSEEYEFGDKERRVCDGPNFRAVAAARNFLPAMIAIAEAALRYREHHREEARDGSAGSAEDCGCSICVALDAALKRLEATDGK